MDRDLLTKIGVVCLFFSLLYYFSGCAPGLARAEFLAILGSMLFVFGRCFMKVILFNEKALLFCLSYLVRRL